MKYLNKMELYNRMEEKLIYCVNPNMKCPKCKTKMKVDLLNRKYICGNSKCKHTILWTGESIGRSETIWI